MSVGEPMIDSQHQKLLNQVNKVIDSMVFGARSEEVKTAVDFFKQYADEHFAYEEAYMESLAYKDIVDHKALHKEFINKYNDFRALLDGGTALDAVLIDVEGFLGQWWVDHIGHEDQKYHASRGGSTL